MSFPFKNLSHLTQNNVGIKKDEVYSQSRKGILDNCDSSSLTKILPFSRRHAFLHVPPFIDPIHIALKKKKHLAGSLTRWMRTSLLWNQGTSIKPPPALESILE